MSLIKRVLCGLLFANAFCFSSWAKPIRFEIRDAAQRDSVQFISDAPFEKIIGVSSAVTGWLEIDPSEPRQGVKGELELDLRAFETANPSRDAFLREKVLNTAEFPYVKVIVGKPLSFSSAKLVDGQATVIRLEAAFTVKGQTRTQPILVKLTYFKQSDKTQQRLNGNLLKVVTGFDLNLPAFGIVLPDPLKFRLAKVIQVSVDAVGTDAAAPAYPLAPMSVPAAQADGPKAK